MVPGGLERCGGSSFPLTIELCDVAVWLDEPGGEAWSERRGLAGVWRVRVQPALQLPDAFGHFRHDFFQQKSAAQRFL